MNSKYLLLFISILVSQACIGQIINIDGGHQGKYGFMGTDNSIRGTKFYFDNWGLGKITFSDKNISNPMLLQVDLESNTLLVKDKNDDTKGITIKIDEVEKFTIAKIDDKEKGVAYDTFLKKTPADFESSMSNPKYYKQHTKESDYVIQEITKSIFDNSSDNTNNFNTKSYKEYRTKNTFYIKNGNGSYIKSSKLNERAFIKAFPGLKKEIKNYSKTQNLNFDNPIQLDALISFCLSHTKE